MWYFKLILNDQRVGMFMRYGKMEPTDDGDEGLLLEKITLEMFALGVTTLVNGLWINQDVYNLYREKIPNQEIFLESDRPNLDHFQDEDEEDEDV